MNWKICSIFLFNKWKWHQSSLAEQLNCYTMFWYFAELIVVHSGKNDYWMAMAYLRVGAFYCKYKINLHFAARMSEEISEVVAQVPILILLSYCFQVVIQMTSCSSALIMIGNNPGNKCEGLDLLMVRCICIARTMNKRLNTYKMHYFPLFSLFLPMLTFQTATN